MKKWIHRLTEINTDNKTAICANCGPIDIRNKGTWRCGNALRKIANDSYHKKMKELYPDRPEKCEVCGDGGKICWDHDHETGGFRGWLCNRCNRTLGFVIDDPELLRKLADYLER